MTETPVWIHLSSLTKCTSVLLTTSPLLLDWPLLLLDLLVWVKTVLVLQIIIRNSIVHLKNKTIQAICSLI